jgi:pyruvate-ferredoxin/flavodoxin oxidoreductase
MENKIKSNTQMNTKVMGKTEISQHMKVKTDEILVVDGNEAVADVAYRMSELAIIYPITPSSPMGEHSDVWSANGRKNIWDITPEVAMMQSEAGAAGAVHGALQMGTLATTFTASQGLLLMIPNMYKIAAELTPFVMHIAARSVATHALSIFGDHSDVMAARQTGFAMLASANTQEAHDFAAIAHAATLKAKIPFLHFFDGFITSHEIQKLSRVSDDVLKKLVDQKFVDEKKSLAMTPENPKIRGTAQNPDIFFQAREAVNPYYNEVAPVLKRTMEEFAKLTGRKYGVVEYYGDPNAERVIVTMASSCDTVEETLNYLNKEQGEKAGLIKVRMYRPFPTKELVEALPDSVKKIAVLDRTKEPGAVGEPLYMDVVNALAEEGLKDVKIIGGRYGLSSKEFDPKCVKAIYDELKKENPKEEFTVGINDDLTKRSLELDNGFDLEDYNNKKSDGYSFLFYGLGSDGTVGANKNTIKILSAAQDYYGQGKFVYDSKKAGAVTISHLRFRKEPIKSAYKISKSDFLAVHHFPFFYKQDILSNIKDGGILLINSPYKKEALWKKIPAEVQKEIKDKNLKVYAINAYDLALEVGLGRRINTIMQTCFFKLANENFDIMPFDKALDVIKKAIRKTYGKKGDEVVNRNIKGVDGAVEKMYELDISNLEINGDPKPPIVSNDAPDFVKNITAKIIAGEGDNLPVSAFTPDGSWPTATSQYEKRAIATEIPIWDQSQSCIQCGKCSFVCPHAAIRTKVIKKSELKDAPQRFRTEDYKGREFKDDGEEYVYVVQVAPEDCTGCGLCVEVCPARPDKEDPDLKAINMRHANEHREIEKENFNFFMQTSNPDRSKLKTNLAKHTQLMQPLFEFSGACAGCGETPYIKLLTQLYGDRMIVANATGCSSIYGGNLPTTPYAKNEQGYGPVWSNSLFEDNAEYGYGMRLAVDKFSAGAFEMIKDLSSEIGEELVNKLIETDQSEEQGINAQRQLVAELKDILNKKLANGIDNETKSKFRVLLNMADFLVRKVVWIIGGDGWAYDIGYGGLDHILNMDRNVNVLVMDTEGYANTGGQMSKATPLGASMKFASAGRPLPKKDLGITAMMNNRAYIAQIAMGANDAQALRAINEAVSYNGPSLIIAYSHCIEHGYNLRNGLTQQKKAVECGYWPLYRYDPRKLMEGKAPMQVDSKLEPKIDIEEYMLNENRYQRVAKQTPERFEKMVQEARSIVNYKLNLFRHLKDFKPYDEVEVEQK